MTCGGINERIEQRADRLTNGQINEPDRQTKEEDDGRGNRRDQKTYGQIDDGTDRYAEQPAFRKSNEATKRREHSRSADRQTSRQLIGHTDT